MQLVKEEAIPPSFGAIGRPGSRRRSSFWWTGVGPVCGFAGLDICSSINLDQMFESEPAEAGDYSHISDGNGFASSGHDLGSDLGDVEAPPTAPWGVESANSDSSLCGTNPHHRSPSLSTVYSSFPIFSPSSGMIWNRDGPTNSDGNQWHTLSMTSSSSSGLGDMGFCGLEINSSRQCEVDNECTTDNTVGAACRTQKSTACRTQKSTACRTQKSTACRTQKSTACRTQKSTACRTKKSTNSKNQQAASTNYSISPKNINGELCAPKGPSSSAREKNKRGKKFKVQQTVISNIISNRARPATVINCDDLPDKSDRIKGAVYIIGGGRKKWDGRQWRRVCVVYGCCSSARGAEDFCIVHGRAEEKESIVCGEHIQVIKPGDISLQFSPLNVDSAAAPNYELAAAPRTDGVGLNVDSHVSVKPSTSHTYGGSHLLNKRKSDGCSDDSKLHKKNKMMDQSFIDGLSPFIDAYH